MKTAISVLETALPVFIMLFMGMLCRRKNFITREGVDTLKKVVVNLTLPFALFSAFASAAYTLSAAVIPAVVYVTCGIMLILGFLAAKLQTGASKLAPFVCACFEAGMLGLPLFALLFPQESVSKFAILMLGQDLFVFTVYKTLLVGKTDPKAIVKDLFTSPTLIGVLLGLLVGATGLYGQLHKWGVGGIVDGVTGFVSAPTAAIILLCMGYDFVPKEIPWKKTAKLIVLRLAVTACLLAALIFLNRAVLGGMLFEGALVILFILPPPFIIPVFADEPAERTEISATLSAMTLLTMLLFALAILLRKLFLKYGWNKLYSKGGRYLCEKD